MIAIYSPAHTLHDPEFEYYDGQATPYAERASRIDSILDGCRRVNIPVQASNDKISLKELRSLHGEHYLRYLQSKCDGVAEDAQLMPSVFVNDTYTPLTHHTYEAARHAAGLAVSAAEMIASGMQSTVYALCRPPGHHAEQNAMMGYCYFNNAALAAQRLTSQGKKVAILDIDYHHGNGTQHLFYDRSDVLYVSIHADPAVAFPYGSGYQDERGVREGLGYTHNFPLTRVTTPQQYMATVDKATAIVNKFEPDFLVLSLGFDTYKDDPIGGLGLDERDYVAMGSRIADALAYPTVIVQEGGYNVEMLGRE